MAAGTQVYTIRLGDRLVERMEGFLRRRHEQPCCTEWSRSDFIRVAIEEKIAKGERSRRTRPGRNRKKASNASENVQDSLQQGG